MKDAHSDTKGVREQGERSDDRILRLPAVVELTGLSRASIYRHEQAGAFPRRVRLGPNAVGWKLSALRQWMDSREAVAA